MTEVIEKQITQQDAYLENMRIMNGIIREMKEIPELPSEAPKDVQALEKVEFPEEGGVLTYMEGHSYPYRGFPFFEFVDKIDLIKKVSRASLSGLYHSLKKTNRLWFLTLIPAIWISKSLVRTGVYVFYRIVERFRLKSKMYCQALRELYRAFSIPKENELVSQQELRFRLRDLICMVLEFDNAYRFRLQDILEELNKDNAKKNFLKELDRLLSIMQTREVGQDIKDTWTLLKLFVRYYLRFDRELREILQTTLLELDIEKIKLTPEDIHYCEKRKDYVFGHMKK